jgi:DNA polymerase-4
MDAFFASIEQRDFPALRSKPIAVGGGNERGVVSAASYEARKFGVRSAMSGKMARKLCPNIIFVSHRFEVYMAVSRQIMSIFHEFTDLVEPLSLDEAFLDVTENKLNIPSASILAKKIKEQIKTQTGLTASAGVSYCKFLAKIASDYNKPDGFFLIKPNEAESFLENLPIEKFFGIGKVTAEKMHKLGIHRGKDLKALPMSELARLFGKIGSLLYQLVRGIDQREVVPDRTRKSIGAEATFAEDIYLLKDLHKELAEIANELFSRVLKAKTYGFTFTLKVKFSDFKVITRSKTFFHLITSEQEILENAYEMLNLLDLKNKKIRLLGLSISKLENGNKEDWVQLQFNF